MKKLCCMLLSVFLIAGCSQNQPVEDEVVDHPVEETNTNDNKEENCETYFMEDLRERYYNYRQSLQVYNYAEYVSVVRIDSVDGCDNLSVNNKDYVNSAYTYGKATVVESYKGDLAVGTSIDFRKDGGKISYENYVMSQDEEDQQALREKENHPEFVKYTYEGDVEVEVGKTYLVYMGYIESSNQYYMTGYGGGFREVKDGLALNNYHHGWESIEQLMDVDERLKNCVTYPADGCIETVYDYKNSEQCYQFSDAVALIRLDSIDGSSNYIPSYDSYMHSSYTYGKATIIESYKGDLKVGTSIDFNKVGGIIPYESYLMSREEISRESLSKLADRPDYVNFTYDGDVELETGKLYLAFMNYNEALQTYGTGFGGSLREVYDDVVFNNYTLDWENLYEVVNVE